MEAQVIRSKRRRRTVSARLIKDTLLVHAPAALSPERLETIIANFKIKFEKKKIKDDLERNEPLKDIADRLNKKYFAGALKIHSIAYSTNHNSKFGCCLYKTGDIRISHAVGLMPKWVRDYVLIHEMAHLIEPNHSKAFWDLLSRYQFCERAKGYLMAASRETTDE